MSLCYLDSNFLLAHLRRGRRRPDDEFSHWREAVLEELGPDRPLVSGLVFDEVVYRAAVTWLKEDGDRDPVGTYRRAPREAMQRVRPKVRRLWQLIDSLDLECAVTNQAVVDRARELMDRDHLGARDAFHAAHAIEAGCDYIVSSDDDFDVVREVRRLGPGDPSDSRVHM